MSNEAPTEALRLVPSRDDGLRVGQAILEAHSQWEKEHGVTGAQNPWQEQHIILLGQAAILAAPASPLSEGGGQCSGITGELKSPDLDALEKLADQATPGPWAVREGTYAVHQPEYECWIPADCRDAAFIAAANPATIKALIAELKEARGLLKEALDDFISDEMEQAIRAFLARNGKADLQKMQNNTPRNAPRGLSDEC